MTLTDWKQVMALDIDNDALISLVQERPVLWDKTLEIYKDRIATKSAWREICCGLKEDFENMENDEQNEFCKAVMKRWYNLRDTFSKYLKKKQEYQKNGSTVPLKKYIYHDRLQFLVQMFSARGTEDSMDTVSHMVEAIYDKELFQYDQTTPDENETERLARRKRRKPYEVEVKMLKSVEQPEIQNANMAFFQGMMPHLENFDENEILEFQISVLQTIANIKAKKQRILPITTS